MCHERNSTYYNQHHYRNGIEQDTQVNMQFIGKLEPCYIKCLYLLEGTVNPVGCEKIAVCGEIGEERYQSKTTRAYKS